jgi:hypothetical protein
VFAGEVRGVSCKCQGGRSGRASFIESAVLAGPVGGQEGYHRADATELVGVVLPALQTGRAHVASAQRGQIRIQPRNWLPVGCDVME